jgi:hypothetical protein
MTNQINYQWNCKTVDVYPQFEQLNDVVYNVHWRLTGTTEVEGKTYYAVSIGTQTLSVETIQPEGFIPFPEPSDAEACLAFENQVIQWTTEEMGEQRVNELMAGLEQQIQNQINPPSLTLTIGVDQPIV